MARPRGVSASAIYPSRGHDTPLSQNQVGSLRSDPEREDADPSRRIVPSTLRARSRTVTGIAGSTISEKDEEEEIHTPMANLWTNNAWTLEGMSKTRSEPPKKMRSDNAAGEYEQTRDCVAKAATSILGTSAEIGHEVLSVGIHVLEFVPVPGLAAAARTLLVIWDAVQLVDTNRSACLRLIERCANTLLSIRSDVMDAGEGVKEELSTSINKLLNSFDMVYAFLQKQKERPFIMRLLKRDEILKELETCDDELTNAISMFSLSVQIRILRHLQNFQRTPLPNPDAGQLSVMPNNRASISSQLTLTNGAPLMGHSLTEGLAGGKTPTPMDIPTASNLPDGQVLPTLRALHSSQNTLDNEKDLDALRRLMRDALAAGSDVEMMNALQIKREEMPDALGALQRLLDRSHEPAAEKLDTETGPACGLGSNDLDVKFFENGIDALQRMSRGTLAPLPNWAITKYEVEMDRRIGFGFFSDVYRGTWQGRIVAVKVLCKVTPRELFVREAEIWKDLNHENVLKLYGASGAQADPPHFFVSPYAKNGNLVDYLRRIESGRAVGSSPQLCSNLSTQDDPTEYEPLRYMHEIAKGMQYLHENSVLHGDLKACNVLVEDDGRCVITDFGQSEMRSEAYRISGKSQPHGTMRWQAPELLSGDVSTLTMQMDIWSFAICCSEILNMGRIPWAYLDDNTALMMIVDTTQTPNIPDNEFNTPHLRELLAKCWTRNIHERPMFDQIVQDLGFIRVQSFAPQHTFGQSYMTPLGIKMWSWEDTLETRPGTILSRIPSGEETSGFDPVPSSMTRNRSRFSRQESLSRSASFSTVGRGKPVAAHRRTASSSSGMCMPEPQFYGGSPVAQNLPTPPGVGNLSPAPEISSPTGHYSPPPPGKEGKKGKRASVSSLVALPIHNTSQVSLGDVGYYRGPQDFLVLFNSFYPEEATMKAVRGLPSLWSYIDGGQALEERSKLGRVVDSVLGLLGGEKAGSPVAGSPGGKRRSLPPRESDKPVGPQSKYLYFDQKAPQKWLKDCEPTIIKVFGPSHRLKKKGELKLVTGTYGQSDLPSSLELTYVSTSFSVGHERTLSTAENTSSILASPGLNQPGSPTTSSPIPIPIQPSTSNRRWSRNSGTILGPF